MPHEAPFALAVVIPAHDEAGWIRGCLAAVLASRGPARAQVIVVANGCRDATAALARGCAGDFAARGWQLEVLELAEGSKIAALNAGDAIVRAPVRAYLDADTEVDEAVLGQLAEQLNGTAPGLWQRPAGDRGAALAGVARLCADLPAGALHHPWRARLRAVRGQCRRPRPLGRLAADHLG